MYLSGFNAVGGAADKTLFDFKNAAARDAVGAAGPACRIQDGNYPVKAIQQMFLLIVIAYSGEVGH
jgi:hypothetical protein